ncbi:MAG: argininosuccinate lyase [Roseicyclus sp.]|uniref:argininosuccinate lyase n=1 Tax=Roseicyclus sp. TaxID=1914329 RepID=UPI003A84DD26
MTPLAAAAPVARVLLATALLGWLAACGVDGPPERPEPRPSAGITVTGTAQIGVTGGS